MNRIGHLTGAAGLAVALLMTGAADAAAQDERDSASVAERRAENVAERRAARGERDTTDMVERRERSREERRERRTETDGDRPDRERPGSFEERWAMVLERRAEGLDEAGVRALAAQALGQQWPRFSERLDGILTRAESDAATRTTCAPHISAVRSERTNVDRALTGDGGSTDLNAVGASLAAMSSSLSACAEYAPMASRGNRTPAERDARRERMGEDRTDPSQRPARARGADRTDRLEDDLGRALRQSARRLEGLADRARMMEEGIEARFDG